MTQFKCALIKKNYRQPQTLKFPKIKAVHVKEKGKLPAWISLTGLNGLAASNHKFGRIFPKTRNYHYELYVFSDNAHETMLRLHGVVGMDYLFTLDEAKLELIKAHINLSNNFSFLSGTKEREQSAIESILNSNVVSKANLKKFTSELNKVKKDLAYAEAQEDKEYAELAKLLTNGWH